MSIGSSRFPAGPAIVRAAMRSCFAFSAMLVSLSATGCGADMPGPKLCSEQQSCTGEQLCVIGRCRPRDAVPVPSSAQQLTFSPTDSALLADAQPQPLTHPMELGGAAPTWLLMRFALDLPQETNIHSAFLVLDRAPDCREQTPFLSFNLAHILSPWSSNPKSDRKRPRLSRPLRAATQRLAASRPLRIDLTSIVQQWTEHRSHYHGVALTVADRSTVARCYRSGLTSGRAPELRVYLTKPSTTEDVENSNPHDAAGGGQA